MRTWLRPLVRVARDPVASRKQNIGRKPEHDNRYVIESFFAVLTNRFPNLFHK